MKEVKENIDFSKLKNLTVVKFGAEWCGPCLMLDGQLEEFSNNVSEKVDVLKVDVDKNPEIMLNLMEKKLISPIRSIPHTYIFKNGISVGDVVGANLLQIKEICENNL